MKKKLKLNGDFEFGVELNDKKVRLVIFKNESEYVCRKESFNNLEKFLNKKNDHIFKGQLQLYKKSADINVIVRKEDAGRIQLKDFKECLEEIKSAS